MNLHTLGHPATHAAFFSTPRNARLASEFRRLRQSAVTFVRSMPGMAVLGDDPFVGHLVSAAGFAAHDIVVLRVMVCRRNVTLICVPTRIWRNPTERTDLLRIKREAAAMRSRCILVPQRWLRNSDRLAHANAISGARDTRYGRKEGEAVLAGLASGHRTIGACAARIPHHSDPYGVVLSMAAAGLVTIGRTGKLGTDTPVRLPVA